MSIGLPSYAFGLAAGVLSTLSPCVLPIVPVLVSSGMATNPRGPLALAAGLSLAFAILGTALAWAGGAFGADPVIFRTLGAALIGAIGLVLISTRLQGAFAQLTSGVGETANQWLTSIRLDGLAGQFAIGAVLGVVWTPCVGPTLGAAVVLASQGKDLLAVATLMGLFGLGASLPILAFAYGSRSFMKAARGRLVQSGRLGKQLMGAALVGVSLLILTGLDRTVETIFVQHSPEWLITLATRF